MIGSIFMANAVEGPWSYPSASVDHLLIFLDANVLFSAAYRPDASLRRLWSLPGARLITSVYAAEEARRNLSNLVQRRELEELLDPVEVVPTAASTDHPLFSTMELPDKDRPVLLAAIGIGATHLLTGDFRHFGPFYGKRIEGVLVLPPGEYLSSRRE
jgi:uncharacterized protein